MCQSSSKSFLYRFIQKLLQVDLITSDNRYHFVSVSVEKSLLSDLLLLLLLLPPFLCNQTSFQFRMLKANDKKSRQKKSNPTQHYYYYN